MPRESVFHTFKIALILCVICSVMVSAAAVVLRPLQAANKEREIRKNILLAAGLIRDPAASRETIEELSQAIEGHLIDLDTGREVDPSALPPGLNVKRIDEYDQRRAARDKKQNVQLAPNEAIHGIREREKYSFVYRVEKDGRKLIVLPVYGNGLWSTLYGFLALSPDTRTIEGLTFYEHGETPGLGGEVDNPAWKAQWVGKQPFNEDWDIRVQVTKPGRAIDISQVDGLAGATITSQGVEGLLRFWLGPKGFGPYLERTRSRTEASTSAPRRTAPEGGSDG
ncbi:MAG: Na(+)-translocating NADH-quinone reductase subunit C [Planctomycetales bacterium]